MEKEAIMSYLEKFTKLLDGYFGVETIFRNDILPANGNNPHKAVFWREGALCGTLVFFLKILEGADKEINRAVLKRIGLEQGEGGNCDPYDYVKTAAVVLAEMGQPIQLPPFVDEAVRERDLNFKP